jgi:hypothetical protein
VAAHAKLVYNVPVAGSLVFEGKDTMHIRFAWFLALAISFGLAAYARAEKVYSSTSGLMFYSPQTPLVLDDGSFPTGTGPVRIGRAVLAIQNFSALPANCTIVAEFYDSVDTNRTPVNTGLLASVPFPLGQVAPGGWLIDLDFSSLQGGGVLIPVDAWGIVLKMLDTDTGLPLTNSVTPIWAGDPPELGTNDDWFAADDSFDGIFDVNEVYWFGGPPYGSELYLELYRAAPPPTVTLTAAVFLQGWVGSALP